MPFYTFNQNNSGGQMFGPHFVIIEAKNANEANTVAQDEFDIYFDGVSQDRDCECCGDRWHPLDEYHATSTPEIYGDPPNSNHDYVMWTKEDAHTKEFNKDMRSYLGENK